MFVGKSIQFFSLRLQQCPLWHVHTCGGWLSVYFHFSEWAKAGEERLEAEITWQGSRSGLFFSGNNSPKISFKTQFSHRSKVKWGSYITNKMRSIVFVLEVQVVFIATALISLRERGFINTVILPAHFEPMINTHLKVLAHWCRTGDACVGTSFFLLHQRDIHFPPKPTMHQH